MSFIRPSRALKAGGIGTFLWGLWKFYANYTTALQLPADVRAALRLLETAPPWYLLAPFAALLAYGLWPLGQTRPVPAPRPPRWTSDRHGAYEDEFAYQVRKGLPGAVQRDTPLGEGLAFLSSGKWGCEFGEAFVAMAEGEPYPVSTFRQRAREGEISVWGKLRTNEVFEKVPPDHWAKHGIDEKALLSGHARSKWTDVPASPGEEYHDLMVSRCEMEAWRNDK